MITGASTASLAIVIIDASKGLLTQTRRHAFVASLLGIKDVVLAVNKIDLVDYCQEAFDDIVSDFSESNEHLGFTIWQVISLSALKGNNVFTSSSNTLWYYGPALMSYLEKARFMMARCVCRFSMLSGRIQLSVDMQAASHPARLLPEIQSRPCHLVRSPR